jgi:hypothetical protein
VSSHDEHDDDLEPEVIEGAEIEADTYEEAEDADAVSPRPEVPKASDGIRDKKRDRLYDDLRGEDR